MVADEGHAIEGLAELVAASAPAEIVAVVADAQREALETTGATVAVSIDELDAGTFDAANSFSCT